MPKPVINDYTFYKIVCLDPSIDLSYVGSTANFNKRKHKHKSSCNNENSNEYNYKLYQTIRENGGWSNFTMIELSKREQLTLSQSRQIEEEYRQQIRANMNSQRCYRTEEQKIERYKEWRENNTEKVKNYNKEYQKNNADKINERHKEYNKTNADKITEWRKIKCVCECGGRYTNGNKPYHLKTTKHKEYKDNLLIN